MQWTNETLMAEQLRLEQQSFDGGAERYRKQQQRMLDSGEASSTSAQRRLSREFIEPLTEGIQAYIDHARSKGGRVASAVPFIECVPADVAAFITMKTILDCIPMGFPMQQVAIQIGGRIEDQARFTKLGDAAPKYVKAVQDTLKRVYSKKYKHRKAVMSRAESHLTSQTGSYAIDIDQWVAWPERDLFHIGGALIDIAWNTLEFKGERVLRTYKDHGYDMHRIGLSASVTAWCEEFDEFMQFLSPAYSPCVVQPRDWKSPKDGGYYMPEVSRTLPLVNTNRRRHLKRMTKEQMPQVYAAVNALQAVEWEINTDVLEVAKAVREADLGLAMPQTSPFVAPESPVPPEFDGLRGAELKAAMHPDQYAEFSDWKDESRKVHELENTRASKFLTMNRTLKAADDFKRYPKMHFVYTVDSRGRVYCRSTQASPQGDDLQKALARFHNAKELGEHGRYWLAVQGANTWGEDKAPFDDRVAFIESMEEDIRDIATDPLTFTEWAGADEPWQFLSWALEWNALLEWEDAGKPAAEFSSKTAVAQDGSCSGIQHYSAMLRDRRGGAEVNLTDAGAPQDIYRAVAEVTERKMQEIVNGESELEVKQQGKAMPQDKLQAFCKAWLGFGINRDLTKRPVMILPYGGTHDSTKKYTEEYLSDLEQAENVKAKAEKRLPNPVHPFGDRASELPRGQAVAIFASVLWKSIGEVVVAAKEGMKFIQRVVAEVAKEDKAVEWTTPTGFIVEQCLFEQSSKQVKTKLLGGISPSLAADGDKISVKDMRSSSAPNFVHSMDASHLVMACNRMKDKGIDSIAVVHDSFGTHAGDTQVLRESLSDTLIELYSNNVLEDLKASAEDTIKGEIDIDVPFIGTLDLEETRRSLYAFA